MGLIDRAFGADKNTMLMHRLALHWRMVASHYENFIKKNEPNEQDRIVMAEIQKRSLAICDRAEASIKGFGRATTNILGGSKREYQNRQYWFSD